MLAVRLLLSAGAGAVVDAAARDGRTALHYAAESGCGGLVDELLARGARADRDAVRGVRPD